MAYINVFEIQCRIDRGKNQQYVMRTVIYDHDRREHGVLYNIRYDYVTYGDLS